MNTEILVGAVLLAVACVGFGLLIGYQFGWIAGQTQSTDAWRRVMAHRDPSDDAGA